MTDTNPARPGAPLVALQGVHKSYSHGGKSVHALRGVDLAVAEGEFVAIMGSSGSGKSTLLHIVGGLDRVDSGTAAVAGRELRRLSDRQLTLFRRRQVGMVFQSFNLVETLSALENVALPMVIDRRGGSDARQQAGEWLDRVGLSHRADHRPDALSGGEQQRLAIARAMLMDPHIILADEPTGNLDSANAESICRLLQDLCRTMGKTICIVTHEPAVAAGAQRVLVLKDGRFVGEMNNADLSHDPTLVASRYQELSS